MLKRYIVAVRAMSDAAYAVSRSRGCGLSNSATQQPSHSETPQPQDLATASSPLFVDVKLVHGTMEKRGEQHAKEADEDQAGEERVERCEDLRAIALQCVDGTHPAEDHRRVQERIDPVQSPQEMVAGHPRVQSDPRRADRDADV